MFGVVVVKPLLGKHSVCLPLASALWFGAASVGAVSVGSPGCVDGCGWVGESCLPAVDEFLECSGFVVEVCVAASA